MRCALVLAAVTAAFTGEVHAAAESSPVGKPGHWQITTIAPAFGTSTIEACITESDSIAAPADGRDCTVPEVKHAGDQVIVNVVCKTKLGEERTSTLYTGDFTTWYRGIMKMTFDPPTAGLANKGVTLDAKYGAPNALRAQPARNEKSPRRAHARTKSSSKCAVTWHALHGMTRPNQ